MRHGSTVPRTAELLEERIALGLQGDQQAREEARAILRTLIPDRIRLSKKADGELVGALRVSTSGLVGHRFAGRGLIAATKRIASRGEAI